MLDPSHAGKILNGNTIVPFQVKLPHQDKVTSLLAMLSFPAYLIASTVSEFYHSFVGSDQTKS